MPLGKLSKTQIAKGFECLEEVQAAIEGRNICYRRQTFIRKIFRKISLTALYYFVEEHVYITILLLKYS